MAVFIAGAKTTGLPNFSAKVLADQHWPKSQARKQQVNKSSHKPFAILASVCADSGAMRQMSAQLRSSM